MATFTAGLRVNMAALSELSGLFSGSIIPLNVSYGASDVTYDIGSVSPILHVDFHGTFTGSLAGGTMTGIHVTQDGNPLYDITGFSAPVQTLLDDATASHVMSFFYGLFAGADSINGSSQTDFLWGLGGNDRIIGKAGNDFLYGGPGKDTITGGTGQDKFFFDSKPNGTTNVDTITDFQPSNGSITPGDHIYLAEYVANGFVPGTHTVAHRLFYWKNETTGTLAQSAFHVGPKATSSSQHIIYDQAHGRLYYDPDGSGHLVNGHHVNSPQVEFAVLAGHQVLHHQVFPVLHHQDFFII